MIYLAQFRFGTHLEQTSGEFSFMAEASSQEDAEVKLVRLLVGAVKNKRWFPAPCRILLAQLAEMDALPATGLVFHHRKRVDGEFTTDDYHLIHLPPTGVRMLYNWDNIDWDKGSPVPLIFVDRERNLTFPTENVPPALW